MLLPLRLIARKVTLLAMTLYMSGRSKTTGKTITLEGHTLHRWCTDGVTPCQFLGYEFKNGRFIYSVLERGVLKVEKNGHLLIYEKGEWNY